MALPGNSAEPRQISALDKITNPAAQLPGGYVVVDVPNPAYNAQNPTAVPAFLTRALAFGELVQLLTTLAPATNAQRGTPKIVLYKSAGEAGVSASDSTLDRLPTAVLCIGTPAVVLRPQPHRLVLAADPTGPLTVAADGSFRGPTETARWVSEVEAYAAGVPAFNELRSQYEEGEQVSRRIAGRLRLFSAARLLRRVDFDDNKIPAPTGITGDANWEEISEAARVPPFYEVIYQDTFQQVASEGQLRPGSDYRLIGREAGALASNDVLVHAVSVGAIRRTAVLDPDGARIEGTYDLATDTFTPGGNTSGLPGPNSITEAMLVQALRDKINALGGGGLSLLPWLTYTVPAGETTATVALPSGATDVVSVVVEWPTVVQVEQPDGSHVPETVYVKDVQVAGDYSITNGNVVVPNVTDEMTVYVRPVKPAGPNPGGGTPHEGPGHAFEWPGTPAAPSPIPVRVGELWLTDEGTFTPRYAFSATAKPATNGQWKQVQLSGLWAYNALQPAIAALQGRLTSVFSVFPVLLCAPPGQSWQAVALKGEWRYSGYALLGEANTPASSSDTYCAGPDGVWVLTPNDEAINTFIDNLGPQKRASGYQVRFRLAHADPTRDAYLYTRWVPTVAGQPGPYWPTAVRQAPPAATGGGTGGTSEQLIKPRFGLGVASPAWNIFATGGGLDGYDTGDSRDRLRAPAGSSGYYAFYFTGTGFALWHALYEGQAAIYDVWVDGAVVATVNRMVDAHVPAAEIYRLGGLAEGVRHEVRLVANPAYAGQLIIDQLRIVGAFTSPYQPTA